MRFLILLTIIAIPLAAQEPPGVGHSLVGPRYDEPQDIARGEQLFRQSCAVCHGAEAKGGANGPALDAGRFKRVVSDNDLYSVIANGIAGTTMPASAYETPDIWRIIAYLRSLAITRSAVATSGDPAAGRAILAGKGRCLNCHTVGAEGKSGGPDLSEIGTLLSVGQLEKALVDPSAEVNAAYWRAKATTKSGETVTGYRLNEDTFSVQIRAGGRLRSLDKRELAEYEVINDSPMPSYRDRLTESERDDLVAYLSTLGVR